MGSWGFYTAPSSEGGVISLNSVLGGRGKQTKKTKSSLLFFFFFPPVPFFLEYLLQKGEPYPSFFFPLDKERNVSSTRRLNGLIKNLEGSIR
jgi:hypothetical protein